MSVNVDHVPSRPPAASAPAEIIESWLPAIFSGAAHRPEGSSPRLRLSLSGSDGGEWDMQIEDGELVVARRVRTMHVRGDDPDVWIRQSTSDFLAVIFPNEDLFQFLPASADVVELLSPESQELELIQKLDGRIKFELEGRRRRRWAVDVAFGRSGMLAGRPRTTVSIDSRTCEKLAARTMNPLQALLAGRLRVDGDKTFAMQVLMLVATRLGG
jgi:putative sterol carrier protein